MAHAGLRPEVLGNYYATDGLRLKDFPDLRIKGDSVEFTRFPAMVVVRPELSKASHRYFSFLSAEGCGYVRDYLQERAATGEKLTPETDLIHARNVDKPFIRTTNVGDGIREGIRAVMGREVKMRPYALRAYFDTQLLLAESRGKVAHDYRVFWMGHKGSMESRCTTNKGRLPQHFLGDIREAYHRCEPFLGTTTATDAGQVDAAVNRQFLRVEEGGTLKSIAVAPLSACRALGVTVCSAPNTSPSVAQQAGRIYMASVAITMTILAVLMAYIPHCGNDESLNIRRGGR